MPAGRDRGGPQRLLRVFVAAAVLTLLAKWLGGSEQIRPNPNGKPDATLNRRHSSWLVVGLALTATVASVVGAVASWTSGNKDLSGALVGVAFSVVTALLVAYFRIGQRATVLWVGTALVIAALAAGWFLVANGIANGADRGSSFAAALLISCGYGLLISIVQEALTPPDQ